MKKLHKNGFVMALLCCFLCGATLSAQETAPQSQSGSRPEGSGKVLSQIEALTGENLQLKFDSIDKQMRLMQAQYAGLQQQQAEIVRQLQELEREILEKRGFKPGEHAVNWQGGRIQKQEAGSKEPGAAGGVSQESGAKTEDTK